MHSDYILLDRVERPPPGNNVLVQQSFLSDRELSLWKLSKGWKGLWLTSCSPIDHDSRPLFQPKNAAYYPRHEARHWWFTGRWDVEKHAGKQVGYYYAYWAQTLRVYKSLWPGWVFMSNWVCISENTLRTFKSVSLVPQQRLSSTGPCLILTLIPWYSNEMWYKCMSAAV